MVTERADSVPWYVELGWHALAKIGFRAARIYLAGSRSMGFDVKFEHAKRSVDILAATAGTVVPEQYRLFDDALRRGVQVRCILADFDDASALAVFAASIQADAALVKSQWDSTRAQFARLQETFKTTIEVRLLKRGTVPMHAMWIRDGKDAVVDVWSNVGAHGRRLFRVFGDDVARLRDDFDALWKECVANEHKG